MDAVQFRLRPSELTDSRNVLSCLRRRTPAHQMLISFLTTEHAAAISSKLQQRLDTLTVSQQVLGMYTIVSATPNSPDDDAET
jgi:hypothetical protein